MFHSLLEKVERGVLLKSDVQGQGDGTILDVDGRGGGGVGGLGN